MAGYLHYPTSPCSINDIAKQTCIDPNTIEEYTSTLNAANSRIANPNSKQMVRPFILPKSSSNSAIHIPACTPEEHHTLKYLSASIGGAGVMALADLLWETKIPSVVSDLNTFGGNGMGAAARASGLILNDIAHYDKVLSEYEGLRNHGAVQATLARKEPEVKRAFTKMNNRLNAKGQQILKKHAVKTREVLNQTGRVVRESIPISSHADVQKLAKFAKGARILGPGAILLDGYFRANNVVHEYKNNNPEWKRSAVVQTASFGLGIGAGIFIGFVFAPAFGGIIFTLAVAGTVGVIADKVTQIVIEKAYDGLTQ